MRLTNEVKDYIKKRVEQLVPKSIEEAHVETFRELLDEACLDIASKLDELICKKTDEMVTRFPDLMGLQFKVARYGTCPICYEDGHTKIVTELREANILRDQYIENIIAMVQFDAQNCKDSVQLDERIVELANR